MTPQRFCPMPFKHFRLATNGDLSLCAPGRLKIPVVGNVIKDGIAGAWNSEKAVELRKSILDGSYRYCSAEFCPALAKRSLPSRSSIRNPKYRNIIDNNRTIIEEGPEELNLHYDVTCNLKCPTCRPKIIGLRGEDLERVLSMKDSLLEGTIIDNVRNITLCGYGDPFASRVHLEFLRSIDNRRFPYLKIDLLTNGLLLTEDMWNTFPGAHSLINEVAISIDAATAETYQINRGGDFAKLLQNLDFISGLRKERKISRFRINFVVQKNNYKEMEAFVQIGYQFGCDIVMFQKLSNSSNSGMRDFADRAVHESSHPEHGDLLDTLAKGIFRDPIVDLYTISNISRSGADDEGIDPLSGVNETIPQPKRTHTLFTSTVKVVPPVTAAPTPENHKDEKIHKDEIERLQLEVNALRREREALKIALAIFARDQKI